MRMSFWMYQGKRRIEHTAHKHTFLGLIVLVEVTFVKRLQCTYVQPVCCSGRRGNMPTLIKSTPVLRDPTRG